MRLAHCDGKGCFDLMPTSVQLNVITVKQFNGKHKFYRWKDGKCATAHLCKKCVLKLFAMFTKDMAKMLKQPIKKRASYGYGREIDERD